MNHSKLLAQCPDSDVIAELAARYSLLLTVSAGVAACLLSLV